MMNFRISNNSTKIVCCVQLFSKRLLFGYPKLTYYAVIIRGKVSESVKIHDTFQWVCLNDCLFRSSLIAWDYNVVLSPLLVNEPSRSNTPRADHGEPKTRQKVDVKQNNSTEHLKQKIAPVKHVHGSLKISRKFLEMRILYPL